MKRKLCFAVLLLLLGLSSVAADTPIQVGGTFYNSLQEAYNAAPNGGTIFCKAVLLGGGITANRAKTVTIAGGRSDDWSSIIGKTTVPGAIVMQAGSLVFGHCISDQGNTNVPPPEDEWVDPNPSDNNFGTAPESFALSYLGNYQYMDLSYWNVPYLYRWLDAYGDYPFGCVISQLSYTPSCKPYLPLWAMGGTYASITGYQDCFGISPFDDYIKSAISSRPALISGWKTGWDYTYLGHDPKACLYKCFNSLKTYCSGGYCDGSADICAINTYIDRLRIVHPIGEKMAIGENCEGDNFDYGPYPDGPDVRYCYPHEITPDFWGCLPADEALTPGTGVLAMPNGHESYPADWSLLGSELNKGDAYIELRTLPTLGPRGCLDNYGGNVCGSWASSASTDGLNVFLPSTLVCYQISDRARAFDYDNDGDWDEIFITGYMTSSSVRQDILDNMTALFNFQGASTYSPNVQAVWDFLYGNFNNLDENLWLRGHSLGGQDALVLAHDDESKMFKRVTTYGVAVNTPDAALHPSKSWQAMEHYVDPQDNLLSKGLDIWHLWDAGVNVIAVDIGGDGWTSSKNPHSRRLYQIKIGHPVR